MAAIKQYDMHDKPFIKFSFNKITYSKIFRLSGMIL